MWESLVCQSEDNIGCHSLIFTLSEAGSVWCCSVFARLTDPRASRDLFWLHVSSHLRNAVLQTQVFACQVFKTGFGDTHSCHQVCTASVPVEPFPQPWLTILKVSVTNQLTPLFGVYGKTHSTSRTNGNTELHNPQAKDQSEQGRGGWREGKREGRRVKIPQSSSSRSTIWPELISTSEVWARKTGF